MDEGNAAESYAVCSLEDAPDPPAVVLRAGRHAEFAYREFFDASIDNPHTRRAYRHAVDRLLRWCEQRGIELARLSPWDLGGYLRTLQRADGAPLSKPSQKLHLAALRHFFDRLVVRHAIPLNPAASVRGPRLCVVEGHTPAMAVAEARRLLTSIETTTLIGLRDRAIIGVLIYTAVRVGAVAMLRRRDFFSDGRHWLFRFSEKGGKERVIPVRHDLEGFVREYLDEAGEDAPTAPLFVSLRRGRVLGAPGSAITPGDILRLVRRRLRRAELPAAALSW